MAPLGSFVLACALLVCCAATSVRQCSGKKYEDLSKNVQLTPCTKTPCKLKKGTDQHIQITFTPKKDYADILDQVNAELFGLPLPFIGVNGNSICNKLFNENDEKVECPVKKGTKYVYKDSFPVLDIYPSVSLKVVWQLIGDGKEIICFEVPAKIE